MKNKIFFFGILLILIGNVNACSTIINQEYDNFNVAILEIVGGSTSKRCSEFSNTTHNYLQCCPDDTAVNGQIVGYRGISTLEFLTPDFEITFTVNFTNTDNSQTLGFIGLSNNTQAKADFDITTKYPYMMVREQATNQLYLYCNGVLDTDMGVVLTDQAGTITLEHTKGSSVVNVYVNGGLEADCPYQGEQEEYLPVMGLITLGGLAVPVTECAQFSDISGTSNYTLTGNFLVYDEVGRIENCSIDHVNAVIGETPYYTPSNLTTNALGITSTVEYNPSCVHNEGLGGWFAFHIAEATCTSPSTGNTLTGLVAVDIKTTNEPLTTNISVQGDLCNQLIWLRFPNGSDVNDPNVEMTAWGANAETINAIFQNLGIYKISDLNCQSSYTLTINYLNFRSGVYVDSFNPSTTPLYLYLQETQPDRFAKIEFQIKDYGTINMNNNRVRVWECKFFSSCTQNCENIESDCTPITSDFITTNGSGYKKFENITIQKDVVCGQSKYSGIETFKNICNAQSTIFGYNDIDINISYGLYDINNEFCFGFLDSVTGNSVTGVRYIIFGREYEYYDSIINDASICLNFTTDENSFAIKGIKDNYNTLTDIFILSVGETIYFLIDPIDSNVSQDYKFAVSGYTLLDGTGTPDIKLKSSCHTLTTNTNNTGYYEFLDIVKGKPCCIEIIDIGYNANKRCLTVSRNFTDYNLTLTEKEAGIFDVTFKTFLSGNPDLTINDVLIKATRNNVTTTCPTRTDGRCQIPDMIYNEIYTIEAVKTNYKTFSQTIKITDSAYDIPLTLIDTESCEIKGYVKLLNNSVEYALSSQTVDLIRDGSKVRDIKTDLGGFYRFTVLCSQKYDIRSTYGTVTKIESVTTPAGEGSVSQNFLFSQYGKENIDRLQEGVNGFIYLVSILFPLIGLAIILLFCKYIWDALFS